MDSLGCFDWVNVVESPVRKSVVRAFEKEQVQQIEKENSKYTNGVKLNIFSS